MASGLVPFVWLVLWVIFIEDSPGKAKWISPDEREYLERTLADERIRTCLFPLAVSSYIRTLLQTQVLVMVGYLFLLHFRKHWNAVLASDRSGKGRAGQ